MKITSLFEAAIFSSALIVSPILLSAETINQQKTYDFLDDENYTLDAIKERAIFAEHSSLVSLPAVVYDAALYQNRNEGGLEIVDKMVGTLESISVSVSLEGRWLCVATLSPAETASYNGKYEYTGGWRETVDGFVACFFYQ